MKNILLLIEEGTLGFMRLLAFLEGTCELFLPLKNLFNNELQCRIDTDFFRSA